MEATDVNVAEILSVEENQTYANKIKEAIEKNPVLVKALEVAKTVEEVYGTMKDYVQMKLEDFKVCFEKSMDFFRESKTELPDEVLDAVAGGGWLSNFWNKYKTAIIATAIVAGTIASGGALGLVGGVILSDIAMGVAGGLVAGAVGGALGAAKYVVVNS